MRDLLRRIWVWLTPQDRPFPHLGEHHYLNRVVGTCVVCKRHIYSEQAISFSHSGDRCGKHFDS